MQAFEYASPATLHEALGLLGPNWGDADVLAGGTDKVNLMKDYLHTPKRVVNIKGIKELEGIRRTSAGLRIGALVTMDEIINRLQQATVHHTRPYAGSQEEPGKYTGTLERLRQARAARDNVVPNRAAKQKVVLQHDAKA